MHICIYLKMRRLQGIRSFLQEYTPNTNPLPYPIVLIKSAASGRLIADQVAISTEFEFGLFLNRFGHLFFLHIEQKGMKLYWVIIVWCQSTTNLHFDASGFCYYNIFRLDNTRKQMLQQGFPTYVRFIQSKYICIS